MDFSRVLKSDLRVDSTLAACWILAPNSASLTEVTFSTTSAASATTGSTTAGAATTGSTTAGAAALGSFAFLATLGALASITTFSTTGAGADTAGFGVCLVCLTISLEVYTIICFFFKSFNAIVFINSIWEPKYAVLNNY